MVGTGEPYPSHPVIERPASVLVLVYNLFVPGSGTAAAALFTDRRALGVGIIQLVLCVLVFTYVIAWIWALVSSILILANSAWQQRNTPSSPQTALHVD